MRLIDADALIEQMEADMEQMEEPLAKMFTGAAISDIKHAPTAEAPDINVGNIDTTDHDSIPAETGKNDGDKTSGDCISRTQAIDALRGYLVEKRCPDDGTLTCRLIENEVINKLPSIQPERKTGRWIPDNTDYYRTKFICSACGESEEVPTIGFGYGTMWDYCPMCGAKMEKR